MLSLMCLVMYLYVKCIVSVCFCKTNIPVWEYYYMTFYSHKAYALEVGLMCAKTNNMQQSLFGIWSESLRKCMQGRGERSRPHISQWMSEWVSEWVSEWTGSILTACSVFLAKVSFSSQSRAKFWTLLAIWSRSSNLNTHTHTERWFLSFCT